MPGHTCWEYLRRAAYERILKVKEAMEGVKNTTLPPSFPLEKKKKK